MEHKLYEDGKPHSHDLEFYKDREVADHINQHDHRPRLLKVLEEVTSILNDNPDYSVADFGCGNGGLLELIPTENKWGYDLCPANVEVAKKKGRSVEFKDFVNEPIKVADIIILTETLEHLVDPHGFLKRLKKEGVKFIVASTPAYETPEFHADFHLWIWTENSFAKVFTDAGWNVEMHDVQWFQFIVASR